MKPVITSSRLLTRNWNTMSKVKVISKMSVVDHAEDCPMASKPRKAFSWYRFMTSEATPKCPCCKAIVTHETIKDEVDMPQRDSAALTDSAKLTR
jgi:hypothetical protein